MEEHGVQLIASSTRGIPQKNEVLNQVYANVLNKPILIPQSDVTSLGSAIFAAMAAKAFSSLEQAQDALCPKHRVIEPDPKAARVYQELYRLYASCILGSAKPTARRSPWDECFLHCEKLRPTREGTHDSEKFARRILEVNLELVRRPGAVHLRERQRHFRSDALVVIKPSGVPMR